MKTAHKTFLAVFLSASSCFAIWIGVMEVANSQMGLPLPVCILLMAAASLIVGFGLGARTYLVSIGGGILPMLLGIIAVTPLLLWKHDKITADPGLHKLWPLNYGLIMLSVFVPNVIGCYAFRIMAARAGIERGASR